MVTGSRSDDWGCFQFGSQHLDQRLLLTAQLAAPLFVGFFHLVDLIRESQESS